jgi:HSP20 family protein
MNSLIPTETRPETAHRVLTMAPLTNILETEEGYLLEAEMPGVNKTGLEVTVENGQLLIVGRRSPVEKKGTELFRESRQLDYRRVFELDPSIDTEKIKAQMDQGLAQIHLPKAESVKPRKITVS